MAYVTSDEHYPVPSFVCDEQCCVVGWDDELDEDDVGVTPRPMFEVLSSGCSYEDNGGTCCCWDDLDEKDWKIYRKILDGVDRHAERIERNFFAALRKAIAADRPV